MPVYDKRRMEIDASEWPDQICIVLKPMQSKSGDGQVGQSGAVTIETIGMTAYLPIYTNYQTAMQAYPDVPIYLMSLVEFKRELGVPI
jgi:hypothetical protein